DPRGARPVTGVGAGPGITRSLIAKSCLTAARAADIVWSGPPTRQACEASDDASDRSTRRCRRDGADACVRERLAGCGGDGIGPPARDAPPNRPAYIAASAQAT